MGEMAPTDGYGYENGHEPEPGPIQQRHRFPPQLTPAYHQATKTWGVPGTNSGKRLFTTHTVPDSSVPVDPDTPTWKRLISHALPPHDAVPLIEAILTSEEEVKTICRLCGDDAQTVIDRIHEVCLVFFLQRYNLISFLFGIFTFELSTSMHHPGPGSP